MKFLQKLERKIGRYAIPNLMNYIIALYAVGTVINYINPQFFYSYLALNAEAILHGQVWRILTFLMQPPASGILWCLIALYMYYLLGTTLERTWGSFLFNVYFFMGVIGHVLAAIVIYLVFHVNMSFDTNFINMSLFFAFALTYPDMEFLLFFIIPVKAKWLAIFDGVLYAVMFISGGAVTKVEIVLSLLNFIIYFLMTRNYSRVNPKQIRRRREYRREAKPKLNADGARHKCAVCGQTEISNPDLEFRYCSKCQGSYEYCMEHLYTHKHVGTPQ